MPRRRRFVPKKPTPFKPFEDDSSAAYIYLLTNRAFRYVKIGFTQKSPKERANQLASATGVPGEFMVKRDWFVPADQAPQIEKQIHQELKRRGYHHKKEFFDIQLPVAVEIIESVLETNAVLELSREKEEVRLEKLRAYYDRKKLEARLKEEKREEERRSVQNAHQLHQFREILLERLKQRHRLRTAYLPNGVGIVCALLSVGALSVLWPPLVAAALVIGGVVYWLVLGLFKRRTSTYISRRYAALLEERVSMAKQYLYQANRPVEDFISTEECASLLRLD